MAFIFPCRSYDDLRLSHKKTVKLLKESTHRQYWEAMDQGELSQKITNLVHLIPSETKTKRIAIKFLLLGELLLKSDKFAFTRIFINVLKERYDLFACLKINPSFTILRLQLHLDKLKGFNFPYMHRALINEMAVIGMVQECKQTILNHSINKAIDPFYPDRLSPELRILYKQGRIENVFQAILGFITFSHVGYVRMPPYLLGIILDWTYHTDFIFGPTCVIKMIDLVWNRIY